MGSLSQSEWGHGDTRVQSIGRGMRNIGVIWGIGGCRRGQRGHNRGIGEAQERHGGIRGYRGSVVESKANTRGA